MDYSSPEQLMARVKQQLDWTKIKPTPLIEREIFKVALPCLITGTGELGRQVAKTLVLDTYGKCTAMLSNVPGPPTAAYFCGQKVEDLMFYAFAPLGVYIGVISYNGTVSAGICCMPDLEPDAGKIAKHWRPAFEELLEAALKLPDAD